MKNLLFAFTLLLPITSLHASIKLADQNKLATVTLHTEVISGSNRVYLSADFEANHHTGVISCDLSVQHRAGKEEGTLYHLNEDTSLLPNEKISFNLGIFPSYFHASGLDVKAKLTCQKLTFFDNKPTSKPNKKLLRTDIEGKVCCKLNALRQICSYRTGSFDSIIELDGLKDSKIISEINELDYCYPQS